MENEVDLAKSGYGLYRLLLLSLVVSVEELSDCCCCCFIGGGRIVIMEPCFNPSTDAVLSLSELDDEISNVCELAFPGEPN